jgi:hypothetical protein
MRLTPARRMISRLGKHDTKPGRHHVSIKHVAFGLPIERSWTFMKASDSSLKGNVVVLGGTVEGEV